MSSNGEISAARRGCSMNSSKESQSHSRWECKYRVVFISKYRKKSLYGWVRKDGGGGDSSQNHGSSEELRSAEFLGQGVLCIDGESRLGTRYAITSQSKRKWING